MVYTYSVRIEAENREHADRVLAERLNYDEEYENSDGELIEYEILAIRFMGCES